MRAGCDDCTDRDCLMCDKVNGATLAEIELAFDNAIKALQEKAIQNIQCAKSKADTVAQGQWIRLKDEKGKLFPWYQCSKCGCSPAEYGDKFPPYCHCCGAKMAENECKNG